MSGLIDLSKQITTALHAQSHRGKNKEKVTKSTICRQTCVGFSVFCLGQKQFPEESTSSIFGFWTPNFRSELFSMLRLIFAWATSATFLFPSHLVLVWSVLRFHKQQNHKSVKKKRRKGHSDFEKFANWWEFNFCSKVVIFIVHPIKN